MGIGCDSPATKRRFTEAFLYRPLTSSGTTGRFGGRLWCCTANHFLHAGGRRLIRRRCFWSLSCFLQRPVDELFRPGLERVIHHAAAVGRLDIRALVPHKPYADSAQRGVKTQATLLKDIKNQGGDGGNRQGPQAQMQQSEYKRYGGARIEEKEARRFHTITPMGIATVNRHGGYSGGDLLK